MQPTVKLEMAYRPCVDIVHRDAPLPPPPTAVCVNSLVVTDSSFRNYLFLFPAFWDLDHVRR